MASLDETLFAEVKEWMRERLPGEPLLQESSTATPFELFKDGTLLCKLINSIVPNSVPKINQSSLPFKQMENIAQYLRVSLFLHLFEQCSLYGRSTLCREAWTLDRA